jgi:hypothetical protein
MPWFGLGATAGRARPPLRASSPPRRRPSPNGSHGSADGVDGLRDRSSRPLSLLSQTVPATCAAVEALPRQRYTGQQIADQVGVSPATVRGILRRLGLNRLSALEPSEPVRRYERGHPGEIIHIDIKRLGRFEQIGHRITGDWKGQSNSRRVG